MNATAKVKPSYSASIALVLDLTPPTFHDPPLEVPNGDGTTTLVSSTPLAADRLLVDTDASAPLLSADFPIDGNIDIFANAGFLQVELKGAAHVCQSELANCSLTPSSSQHMLKVAFKPHGLMNFGQIVHELLTDPAGLLDFQVKVRGEGSINVTVPSTTDFFHGGTAGATFHWNDLTKTTGTDGPQFDISDLSELVNFDFDPSNPKALFSIILKTLQTLDKTLGDGDPSGASVFNTKIPLVGRSLHDLLKSDESGLGPNVTYTANTVKDSSRSVAKGNAFPQSLVGRSIVAGTQVGIVASVTDDTLTMVSNWTNQPSPATPYTLRSELDDAISILQNSPSDNLQALVKTLNDRLSGLPIQFDYRDDASVGSTPSLVINARLDARLPHERAGVVRLLACPPVPAAATTPSPVCKAAARFRSARAVRSSSAWSCRWHPEPDRRTRARCRSSTTRASTCTSTPASTTRRCRRRSARSASRSATRPAPTRRPRTRATRSTSRSPAEPATPRASTTSSAPVASPPTSTRPVPPRIAASPTRTTTSRSVRSCRSTISDDGGTTYTKLIADPDPERVQPPVAEVGRVTDRLLRPHRRADQRPRPPRVPGPDRRSRTRSRRTSSTSAASTVSTRS